MSDRSKDYEAVRVAIDTHGQANDQFPDDKDLSFGELKAHCSGVVGLQTVVKHMKQQQMVDFGAQGFFKDDDVITLIGDYNAQAKSLQPTAAELPPDPNAGNHLSTAGW